MANKKDNRQKGRGRGTGRPGMELPPAIPPEEMQARLAEDSMVAPVKIPTGGETPPAEPGQIGEEAGTDVKPPEKLSKQERKEQARLVQMEHNGSLEYDAPKRNNPDRKEAGNSTIPHEINESDNITPLVEINMAGKTAVVANEPEDENITRFPITCKEEDALIAGAKELDKEKLTVTENVSEEEYVKVLREYYKNLFFGEESVKKVLRSYKLRPTPAWIKGTIEQIKASNIAEDCLDYTREQLIESGKYTPAQIEEAYLTDKLEEITEIKLESAKVILTYYEDKLEKVLESTESQSIKKLITSELTRINSVMEKFEKLDKPEEVITEKAAIPASELITTEKILIPARSEKIKTREIPQAERDLDRKERHLEQKMKAVIQYYLEEAFGKINSLSVEQKKFIGIDEEDLQEGLAELKSGKKVQELLENGLERYKEIYHPSKWGASGIIEDWADHIVQSAFTVWGNDSMKAAYKRAYNFQKGVSLEKKQYVSLRTEESSPVTPDAEQIVRPKAAALSEKEVHPLPKEKESDAILGNIEKLFGSERRRETIEKTIEAILKVHRKLIEDSKLWDGYKDLPEDERIQSVVLDTKARILNVYDKILAPKMGLPRSNQFKRAFYRYAVSRILE